jgi:rhamnosyltransferase
MAAAPAGVAAATVLYHPDRALLDALLTVLEADGLPVFVFVNGPVDPGIEARLARLARATLLRSPVNIGLGAGLNAVVEAAREQGFGHILLFDQDSTPGPGLAQALLGQWAAAERVHGAVAAIGPVLTPPPGESFLPIRYDRRSGTGDAALAAVDFLPTSGTLVSIQAWGVVGPFRADYFVDGIDVEWCFRAWSRGQASVLAEQVTMSHRWGHAEADGGRLPQILRQSRLRSYYYLRNASHGLRLAHFPPGWKLRTALRLLAQAGLLVLRGGAPLRMLGLAGRAFRDGLTGRLGPAPSAE